jgi:ATP-dependent Clp protease ATP-binding subunit ClpA
MFKRFTGEARAAVVDAQAEARALHHRYIGTEHILLGISGREGLAADVLRAAGLKRELMRQRVADIVGTGASGDHDAAALRSIGIDIDEVRRRVEDAFGPGALERARSARERRRRRWRRSKSHSTGHLPFCPRAKKVLELSLREALRLGDDFIGTEHILLALLRENGGIAAVILSSNDVTYERVALRLEEARRRSAS